MVDPLREIKKKIEEYREQMRDHLMSGGVRTYEDYRHAIGKIEALEYILGDIADIEKKYLDE